MRDAVSLGLGVLGLYVIVGVGVALWLSARGLSRLDPAARSAPWSFRVLVFPGLVGLWPLMLRRARRAKRGVGAPVTHDMRAQRRAHLICWLVLTPVLLGAVAALTVWRDLAPESRQ